MEIRPRTDADLDRCTAFLRTVHDKAGYPINWPDDPRGWLTPPGALGCWVITVGGRVAGHVAVTRGEPGQALVERLFVDPAETGAGLGRRLLDHCLAVATEHDLDLSLEVAENCHAAIALYERAGWRETRRTPIGWGGAVASVVIGFAPPRG
ncbi:acetyltransferase (GNAT) family protein [Kribbella voronezhensis]|uniref:Acetyltransferase (GNAT) family protein n=1 Tax=Kribbella voronezhensis TaxID=2512212 RepID=A0A4R7TAI9_9ACTN|nr:GNAT family N-acetyltransferase [Kribbella voronezhensis]TDU89042.1 acetyltransferase (GNAT) family protein [Kribbella voronezhensis]